LADDWSGYELGKRGREWLRKSLSAGLSLSHQVARAVDLTTGDAYALIPQHFPVESLLRAENFAYSIGLARDESVSVLRLVLGRFEGQLLVVEDELARATDDLPASATAVTTYEDDVLHWCELGRNDDVAPFYESSGFPTNAFVTDAPHLPLARHLSGQTLNHLASTTRLIVVSAFDAEGYIAWAPSSPRIA
jgi:hypothetical protein